MWGGAVMSGSIDDLNALKEELLKVPENSLVFKIKGSITKHIELRIQEINKNK